MRLIAFHLFGLLVLLYFDSAMSTCHIQTNGCSVPGDLPFIYKRTFTPACVKHDVCYYCGQLWGWKRSNCDRRFKLDMYRLCERKSGRRKRWFFPSLFDKVRRCKTFGADVYYRAVTIAGQWYWSQKSPDWCKKPCAMNLGNPAKALKSG